jgi:hypothetical protein
MRTLDRSEIVFLVVALANIVLGIAMIAASVFVWFNPQWNFMQDYLFKLIVLAVCIRTFFGKRIRNYWQGNPQDNDRWWSDGVRTMREKKLGTACVAFFVLATTFAWTANLVVHGHF